MREYIREQLSERGTVLMATHDYDKARPITSRAGVLQQGSIQEISIDTLKPDDFF